MRLSATCAVVALAAAFHMPWQPPQPPQPARAEDPPARIDDVVALASGPADSAGQESDAALGWMKFMAAGYRNAADHLGAGEAGDAELALGGAIENTVKALAGSLAGKKTKARLNDAVEGTITKVDDSGFVVNVNKADVTVPWGEVDPGKLALLLVKGKPTAEPDVAAIATLKLLAGEPGDAKLKAGKLTSELGKKLSELLDSWKGVGPELAAARALDGILREKDAMKAIERFKAGWGAIKATKLGDAVTDNAREQFLLRGEQAWAGEAGLKVAIHGKVKIDPARAHPMAGKGGVGMEIEYDFEKDAEAADFDPAALPRAVFSSIRFTGGGFGPIAPLMATQSRLLSEKANGGILPLEFGGDVDITFEGGIREETRTLGGMVTVGLATSTGSEMVQLRDFSELDVTIDGKPGPNAEKKFAEEELRPGWAAAVTLKVNAGKVSFGRNEDTIQPLVWAPKAPLRPFIAMVGQPVWFIERLVIRGTATKASIDGLARSIAKKEAAALFGE